MEGPLKAGGGQDIACRLVKSRHCWRVRPPDTTVAGRRTGARRPARLCEHPWGGDLGAALCQGRAVRSAPSLPRAVRGQRAIHREAGLDVCSASRTLPSCRLAGGGQYPKGFVVGLCFGPLGLRGPNCPCSVFPSACWQKATGSSSPLSRRPGKHRSRGRSPAWWPSGLKPSAAAAFPPLGVCLAGRCSP